MARVARSSRVSGRRRSGPPRDKGDEVVKRARMPNKKRISGQFQLAIGTGGGINADRVVLCSELRVTKGGRRSSEAGGLVERQLKHEGRIVAVMQAFDVTGCPGKLRWWGGVGPSAAARAAGQRAYTRARPMR